MRILGIETSTARSSVALVDDGTVLAHEVQEDARGHGAFLAPAVARCLAAGGGEVDAVAVGTGPGLYTGLRVGMATAAAFAGARGLPVVGVGGMDALAAAVGPGGGTLVTTLDARRGQVFWAVHVDVGGVLRRVEGPRVGSWDELAADLERLTVDAPVDAPVDGSADGSGDGTVRVVGEVDGAGERAREPWRPDAVLTARLGGELLASQSTEAFGPTALRPVYLREADVRPGWDVRGGVRAGTGAGPDGATRSGA